MFSSDYRRSARTENSTVRQVWKLFSLESSHALPWKKNQQFFNRMIEISLHTCYYKNWTYLSYDVNVPGISYKCRCCGILRRTRNTKCSGIRGNQGNKSVAVLQDVPIALQRLITGNKGHAEVVYFKESKKANFSQHTVSWWIPQQVGDTQIYIHSRPKPAVRLTWDWAFQ